MREISIAEARLKFPRLEEGYAEYAVLDEHTADLVFAEFVGLVRSEGSAALVATHNERIAAKMDRVLRLHEGVLE